MKRTESFALEKHQGPYESRGGCSRLIVDGQRNKIWLPGYVLRHQFETQHGYLLITDYDCPFEEGTNFVLLSKSLRILSFRCLAAPYRSYLLQDVQWIDQRRFIALFYGNMRWCVTIRSWHIPCLRPRLKLQRAPAAESSVAPDPLQPR